MSRKAVFHDGLPGRLDKGRAPSGAPVNDCHSDLVTKTYPAWSSNRCGFYYTDAHYYQEIAEGCLGCAYAQAAIEAIHGEAMDATE